MVHGALFNGIGGFQLPAAWMGWTNLFSCEIDDFCNKVTKKHFPDCIQHGDIKTTDFTIYRGRIDIVTGGFPCQPFSTAGEQQGDTDERYLFREMLRAISEIQPRWIVAENVRGIFNAKFSKVQSEIFSSLETLGYEIQAHLLPASAVGATHERYRAWFIAHSYGLRLEGAVQANASSKELCRFREPNTLNRSISWEGFDLQRSDEHLRRDNGVSDWVHRIKALGNAIVPQVAYQIFKAIEQTNLNGAHT